MSEHPLIYVDVVEDEPMTLQEFAGSCRPGVPENLNPVDDWKEPYARYLDRFQPWRWVAKSGDNHETLAVSSEAYFNEADAKHAADLLFGPKSNVYRRQHEVGNVALRLANWVTVPE